MNQPHDTPASGDANDRSDLDPIAMQAAHWVAVLRAPEVTMDARLRADFQSWREADPRHAQAFAEIERLWDGAARMHPGPVVVLQPRPTRRWLLQGAAAAASVALAVTAGWPLLRDAVFADLKTGVGERHSAVLADGSKVELSTDTSLSVAIDAVRRHIVLHGGEAFFQVAPDAARPFVVEAAGGRITALGTAFAVAYDGDGGVRITVSEHAVAVQAGKGSEAIRLPAGQSLRYRAGSPAAPEPADIAARLAWREGRLVFLSVPLGEVVAELDRWQPGRTVILDAGLRNRPVSLIVDVRRSADMIQTLAGLLPVQVYSVTPWLRVLGPAG